MIEQAIHYLKQQKISFRVISYAMPEPLPEVGDPSVHKGQQVETYVVLAGGRPALACIPAGERIECAALARSIRDLVCDASPRDLPPPFNTAELIPPLGGLIGVPLFLDQRVLGPVIVFRAFGWGDYVELDIDDFARMERPRIDAFAVAGELPSAEPQPMR